MLNSVFLISCHRNTFCWKKKHKHLHKRKSLTLHLIFATASLSNEHHKEEIIKLLMDALININGLINFGICHLAHVDITEIYSLLTLIHHRSCSMTVSALN